MPQAPEPKTGLGRLLRERPDLREPLARAVGWLLGAVLATIIAVCALTIWHLRRRAARFRGRLGPGHGCDLNPPAPRFEIDEDLSA